MDLQNHGDLRLAYLGIGGNLGNREEFLYHARRELNLRCGEITDASLIYETSAWGSESTRNYLNQVVTIKTALAPRDLLDAVREIEQQLGRKRRNDRYADRTIDIDILFYEDIVLLSDGLVIPHPRLHERRFVLVPLSEVAGRLLHPVLMKPIDELLRTSSDTGHVKAFEQQPVPYVCIEGNIGAGKTTMANALSRSLGWTAVLETFDEEQLGRFYKGERIDRLQLELGFLRSRGVQLALAQRKMLPLISDFSVRKSAWFGRVNLSPDEFGILEKELQQHTAMLREPDLVFHVTTTDKNLMNNIANRGRPIESTLEASYIRRIGQSYQQGVRSLANVVHLTVDQYTLSEMNALVEKAAERCREFFGRTGQNVYF